MSVIQFYSVLFFSSCYGNVVGVSGALVPCWAGNTHSAHGYQLLSGFKNKETTGM